MPATFVFLAIAFGAEVVGTITGFGTTTILVPASSLFLPLRQAIVLAGVFHLFGTFWRTLFFARGIHWKVVLLFGIPELAFSALGASLLVKTDLGLLSKLLGMVLVFYALYSLSKHRMVLPHNTLLLSGGGSVVGFLAGLLGTAGALRGAFLNAWNLPKEVYLGTGAAMGLGADLTRVVVYHQTGLLNINPQTTALLAIVALAGTFLGSKIAKATPQAAFTKIVLAGLLLAGLRFILPR